MIFKGDSTYVTLYVDGYGIVAVNDGIYRDNIPIIYRKVLILYTWANSLRHASSACGSTEFVTLTLDCFISLLPFKERSSMSRWLNLLRKYLRIAQCMLLRKTGPKWTRCLIPVANWLDRQT